MSTKKEKRGKSLEAFLLQKKRAECVVCSLPPNVLRQLNAPGVRKKASLDIKLEWLKSEYGVTVTPKQYNDHCRAGHTWRR